MHAYYDAQDQYLEGKAAWEAMTWREQGDLLEAMPEAAKQDMRTLYTAALIWQLAETLPFKAWHDRWQRFVRVY